MQDVSVTFDEEYKVRVLAADKFKQTQTLEQECKAFVTRINEFNGTVRSLVELLSKQANLIEEAKLKAIGKRNEVETETENRKRRKQEIRAAMSEKNAILDRYSKQYDSLVKVETEQRAMIEKLSNNEAQ
mmetsp:Transcript_1739/g.3681  ORF Transcript_1739/g.3681 Transcript_1739/m.3681 type:complete len:130 (+) Transcript_1739:118-507(+)